MKLLFSEFDPDYSRYLFPYVVWAIPEPPETPADLYAAGFHPGSPGLERFVLCRHLRVHLPEFRLSSENRRILRRGEGLEVEVVPREDFTCTSQVRNAWLAFAETRFGAGVMPSARLDGLLSGRVINRVIVCRDSAEGGREVGHALLYVESSRMAHYYYAFYDLTHRVRSLGLFLMTSALVLFQRSGFEYVYLGTCYSERALYKTQFAALEFFNGISWSRNLKELKFLVHRNGRERHLLEEPWFVDARGGLDSVAAEGRFQVPALDPARDISPSSPTE